MLSRDLGEQGVEKATYFNAYDFVTKPIVCDSSIGDVSSTHVSDSFSMPVTNRFSSLVVEELKFLWNSEIQISKTPLVALTHSWYQSTKEM